MTSMDKTGLDESVTDARAFLRDAATQISDSDMELFLAAAQKYILGMSGRTTILPAEADYELYQAAILFKTCALTLSTPVSSTDGVGYRIGEFSVDKKSQAAALTGKGMTWDTQADRIIEVLKRPAASLPWSNTQVNE